MIKNIILDCDNTFGVKDCDIDDGLALIYLLGRKDANVLGVTCTFGNNRADIVYENTKRLLTELGYGHVPILKGCDHAGETQSEAVDFLVETVCRYRGNISILAIGSMNNLYGAYQKDCDFFNKVNEVCLMGGITESLLVDGKIVEELNFSCDYEAAFYVISNARNLAIATGGNCLDAFFPCEEFKERLGSSPLRIPKYLKEGADYWCEYMAALGQDGFINWDGFAASYLMNKALFEDNETEISPSIDSLKSGLLFGGAEKISVKLPKVLDQALFREEIYQVYLNQNYQD